jgi:hypothetical protein
MYELEEKIKQTREGIEYKDYIQKEIICKGTYKTENDDLTMNFEYEQGEIVKVEKLVDIENVDVNFDLFHKIEDSEWFPSSTDKN